MKINPKSQIVTKLLDAMYGQPQCEGKHKTSKRAAAAHGLDAIGLGAMLESVQMLRVSLERGAPLPALPPGVDIYAVAAAEILKAAPGSTGSPRSICKSPALAAPFDEALAAVLSIADEENRGGEGGDNCGQARAVD